MRQDATLSPLRPRRESTGKHVIWSLVPPQDKESCRWGAWDGRWVALTLGTGPDFGTVAITASDGRREIATSYEGALMLAKKWRL